MHRREKTTAERPCDRCGLPSKRLYRVRTEEGGAWVLVCDACWPRVSEGNPHYRYGGTWTSRRRT